MAKKQMDHSDLTIEELLPVLEERFQTNMKRHSQIQWLEVKKALEQQPHLLTTLLLMEKSGGEPDVVGVDLDQRAFLFYDCSAESPIGRRSYCYDEEALNARKKHRPDNTAMQAAEQMGISLLSEIEYAYLQTIGNFDLKTSSWIETPEEVRALGGALFGDKRYSRTFTYHNGADSYYAGRGFRGKIMVPFS